MPEARAHVQIANISKEKRVYQGANNTTGQVLFEDTGSGWYLWDVAGQTHRQSGARITLAMGLTECCMELGRGKVFFFAKDFHTSYDIPYRYTLEYARLPDLLYVDFEWDDHSRNEWLNMPQWQRLDSLSARGNALHQAVPVLPISLVFDFDNYDNIRFTEGLNGGVCLYLNRSGYLYLGFAEDVSAHMQWRTPGRTRAIPTESKPGYRGFWQADKPNVAQFQCMSGPDAVQRLQGLYDENRPQSMYLYRTIITLTIQAHDLWTANGGYSIESDKDLGPELARQVEAAIRRQIIQSGGGTRLQQLQEIVAGWAALKQAAFRGYQAALRRGVFDVSRFMVRDDQWISLTSEEKELIIEHCELEQEVDAIADLVPEDQVPITLPLPQYTVGRAGTQGSDGLGENDMELD